jgi:hypothetical protein
MNFSFKHLLAFAFLASIAFQAHATFSTKNFSNAGNFNGDEVKIEASESLDNTGKINGTQKVDLICGILTGNGKISAPLIAIVAKHFDYTGSIECEKECTITTKTPVDKTKFTQVGKGVFKFVVEPNL